jgi:TetR/AcrR family transcriptional repressor of nem operon
METNLLKIMAKQQITKEKILTVGAEIIHRKGFNNTGIQEILKAAEVPKGSFYFYFKSKEDFGLNLIDFFGNILFAKSDEYLNDSRGTPIERLRRFFNEFLTYFQENDFKGG